MPLFTLGKRSSSASVAAVAAGAAHHNRQSSLSMSSSHKDELAKVRAQTIAMANNGELTISRSKTSSGHTRSGHRSLHNSGHRPTGGPLYVTNRRQHIVAQEPDEDSSKHTKRIDQGILDASRESSLIAANRQKEMVTQQQQQQPSGGSWWSPFSWSAAAPNATTTLDNASRATSLDERVSRGQQDVNIPVSSDDVLLRRKTTAVVSKTFRVP